MTNLYNGKARSKIIAIVMVLSFFFSLGTIASWKQDQVRAEKAKVVASLLKAKKIALQQQKVKEAKAKAEVVKFSSQRTTFTDAELVHMLKVVGFKGKALKVAWAVVKKESKGRPLAHNGNRSTGDNSYGLFQINMIGYLGDVRRQKYDLPSNKALFNPVVNAKVAYQMSDGGADWGSWKVGKGYNGADQKKFLEWYSKFPNGGLV